MQHSPASGTFAPPNQSVVRMVLANDHDLVRAGIIPNLHLATLALRRSTPGRRSIENH